ncbi:MAG: sulfotransferase family protein, partial [Cyanobacteriota bacterium]|nr:sulfotransferase family protein [Cyanobacteriota bacterium]
MAKTSHNFRDSLRDIKNEIIRKYFEYRIQTPHDPYRILFRLQPYRVLFILSHMRSGSSLLTHILNSNPEIIGYGETHLQYSSEADFKRLMLKV